MRILYFLFCIYLLLLGCNDGRYISGQEDLNAAKNGVMINYDDVDFIQLTNYYQDENYQDILAYSLRLTDSVEIANFYFFNTYMKIRFDENVKREKFAILDLEEREFLLYILKKGVKMGDSYCKEELIKIYRDGIGVEQDINYADSLSVDLSR
jgi:hypothetical protein